MSRSYYSEEFSTRGSRPIPTRTGARAPDSSAEAERAIERTRGRISETLDMLETRLRTRKRELRQRADALDPVGDRVRTNPWRTLAIAAGLAFLIGRRRARRRR